MKKLFVIFFLFCCLTMVVFFTTPKESEVRKKSTEKRSVFISYIELNKYIKGKDVKTSKKNIDLMLENISKLGFNTIILQVRSFSDAIYSSDIFPWSSTVSTGEGVHPGYDVLAYVIKRAKEKKMGFYAWINPYRVRGTEDILSITKENPAYPYIGTSTLYVKQGIFYNPSKKEVEDLIVEGVSELVKNYSMDGVLFDDYFYPDSSIDLEDYEQYQKENGSLSLEDYHLMIVNRMIRRVHEACKKYKTDFGISPDGNIENNYNKLYADVKTWVQSDEYIDFIMPQIYYGFYNETKAFKKVIEEWDEMITSSQVDLYIALAFYKVGLVDNYAKSGSNEWLTHTDIMMRQIILSRNLKHYKGFALFRYDYLFNQDLYTDTTMLEIDNMKKILN